MHKCAAAMNAMLPTVLPMHKITSQPISGPWRQTACSGAAGDHQSVSSHVLLLLLFLLMPEHGRKRTRQ